CAQLTPSNRSGASRARRTPKRIAEIGTPCGSSKCGEIEGHCRAGAVKREFGCAAFSPLAGVHGRPCQSVSSLGTAPSIPSHHGERSEVRATFVKSECCFTVAIAFGLVLTLVPGATPKKPASGFTAQRRPSGPNRIQ